MTEENKIEKAIETFGVEVVKQVIMFVDLFDEDGAYTAFEDEEMEDHVACVEFLYFE